jgi:hypothetical protein
MPKSYEAVISRFYWHRHPTDMDYFHLLDRIHQHLVPRTYLEIGVSTGASLTLSLPGTVNVGVDPEPRVSFPLSPTTKIFTETSDNFFATHRLRDELDGKPLDLAFIDGMHHFEFALRDFVNIEQRATPETIVLVHDCYPIDATTAARDRTTNVWSGDVWKLIVCLKRYRPDLRISVVDEAPTGLGVITGLDPRSTVLADRMAEIEAEFVPLPYSYLDDGDKSAILNRVSNDWDCVASLLPSTPYRRRRLAPLVTRRALAAEWPVARRTMRRQAARLRRRFGRAPSGAPAAPDDGDDDTTPSDPMRPHHPAPGG